MAVLADADRVRVWAHWMRLNSEACPFDKTDLRNAVDATDQWIDDNQASFNSALPVPFRTSASLQQKTLLFCFLAMKRAGILTTEND